MRRATVVLCALFLMTLAGCASPTTPKPAEFVDYTRQGGLLGINDHLVVMDNGAATLTRRDGNATFTVDSAQLAKLRDELTAADFDHLDPTYGPEYGCCDQFTHRLRYQNRSVRALDDVAPERLRRVLNTLSEIIATGSR